MKQGVWIGFVVALWMAACSSFPSASGRLATTDPTLASIDSLLWSQPDSAFAQLQEFDANPALDSLDPFNRHYFHLLLSELLYKNYCEQSNRSELLKSVDYFDSIVGEGGNRVHRDLVFLDARAHYIDGVGYYEMDSMVPACEQYLKAVELMEDFFSEKELVGKKAQFMALGYSHLCDLFSDQFLHEQTIVFGKQALFYYNRFEATPWNVSWVLSKMGSQYFMLRQIDSSYYYFNKAQEQLNDTASLIYRDTETLLSLISYRQGEDPIVVEKKLKHLLSASTSEEEYYSRCAVMGDFYYGEKQYDSAWVYLNEVFYGSASSDASKKQAAEWLVEIAKAQGRDAEVLKYASFLVPFANQEDNHSERKSQFTYQYSEHLKRKLEQSNSLKITRGMKQAMTLLGALLAVTIVLLLLYRRTRKAKRDLETQLTDEQLANKTEQKLLRGELERLQKTQKADLFCEEPVCKHIIEVCNDPKNTIKSTLPVTSYSDIALDNTQKIQLEEAALSHYGPLIARLKTDYPQLKKNDFIYCYLCLLGLDDVQIAAMTKRSYRTVWERGERLKKIFNAEDSIRAFLLDLIKS